MARSELYSEAFGEWPVLLERLAADARTLMVVGHNPRLTMLAEQLLGESMPMAPGMVVAIDIELERWVDLPAAASGSLRDLIRP